MMNTELTPEGYKVSIPLGPTAATLETTWANRPSGAGVQTGARIRCTDLGNKEFYWTGSLWLPVGSPVLAQSGVASSVTGTTTRTALASITVPGGLLGANGGLRISAGSSQTNNANAKVLSFELGGVTLSAIATTGGANGALSILMVNRGTTGSQHTRNLSSASTTGIVSVTAINTAVDQVLTISGTLTNATDALTLDAFTVEVLPA